MIILGIDASSNAASVGLYADGRMLCEHTLNNGKNHSVKLLPMVEFMLQEAGLSFGEIDAYACGVGPGSFTGVRIGVATVKGFAQAWNKPVIPLSSLEILGENCSSFEGLRVPVIHARVDEVFCAAYTPEEEVIPPSVMTIDELLEKLRGTHSVLMGNGALMYREKILESLGDSAAIAPEPCHYIRGATVAALGHKRYLEGKFESYEKTAPVYLRVSQAEREYKG